MKRTIGTYFAQYFKMPHLYRDDLDAIEAAIDTTLKPERYLLSCSGVEFGSMAELAAEFDHANVLVISTQRPCVRLKFARSWAELYSGEDGEAVRQTLRAVGQIVSKGQRVGLWAACKYASWLAPLLGFGVFSIGLGLIALGVWEVRSLYLLLWGLGLGAIWWAVAHRYALHNFSRLDFRRPRAAPSAVARHRRALLTFLAGALAGAATLWSWSNYLTRG